METKPLPTAVVIFRQKRTSLRGRLCGVSVWCGCRPHLLADDLDLVCGFCTNSFRPRHSSCERPLITGSVQDGARFDFRYDTFPAGCRCPGSGMRLICSMWFGQHCAYAGGQGRRDGWPRCPRLHTNFEIADGCARPLPGRAGDGCKPVDVGTDVVIDEY